VVRAIGVALLGVGLYFLWQVVQWIVETLRFGGVGIGDVVGLVVVLLMAAAFGVPGAMMAFFGVTARVEPVPRRVFARHGFMGFGGETATDIVDGAKVVVRMHVDQRTKDFRTGVDRDRDVFSYKVFVQQPGIEPVEIGQFSPAHAARARELAAVVAEVLALPVSDKTRAAENAVPEEDRMTSEFLERHGVKAPPKGPLVRTIKVVRDIVEALFQ
jgi:hypothetical protein